MVIMIPATTPNKIFVSLRMRTSVSWHDIVRAKFDVNFMFVT
jgi:hypothetical protein